MTTLNLHITLFFGYFRNDILHLRKFNIELQFQVDENKMSRMGRMSLKRDASTLH